PQPSSSGRWRTSPSRPPAGTVCVRPRPRLALAVVRDRRGGSGAGRRVEKLGPGARPWDVQRGAYHQRGTEGRMAVTVLIPTPLRPFVGGRDAVELEAGSVGELLDRLTGQHAELKPHLFATDGRLRSF